MIASEPTDPLRVVADDDVGGEEKMQEDREDRGSRVLVVHDTTMVAEGIGGALAVRGHRPRLRRWTSQMSLRRAVRLDNVDVVVLVRTELDPAPPRLWADPEAMDVPVLVVVGRQHARWALLALDRGAADCVFTDEPLDSVLDAVDRVAEGRDTRRSAKAAALRRRLAIADARRRRRLAGLLTLSPREEVILADLCRGDRPDVIAASRSISMSTVRTHIKRILRKLSVSSQVEAIALANRRGWRAPRPRDEADHGDAGARETA